MARCLSKHIHGSKIEVKDCNRFFSLLQSKQIKSYQIQKSFKLTIDGKPWRSWKADFYVIMPDGSEEVHETKGFNRSDDNARSKMTIFMINYPHIKLYKNWILQKSSKDGRLLDAIKNQKKLVKTYDGKLKRWVTKII